MLSEMSQGERVVVFGGDTDGEGNPKEMLTVRRTDAGHVALLEAGTAHPFIANELSPVAEPPAPTLERADRAFAADSRTRGAEAWAATVAPRGAWYDGGDSAVGPDAVREIWERVLEAIRWQWTPANSGISASGRYGFTVGTYLLTNRRDGTSVRGSYVTIWEVQFDGTPKWIFSTGR